MSLQDQHIIKELRQQILRWEGYKPPSSGRFEPLGIGNVEQAFPNKVFPKSSVHEVVCASTEQAAASGGFLAGLISLLLKQGGVCVWIYRAGRVFAPALATFGVAPHQIVFIDLKKDADALWVMEEALKCSGLTAVVCELKDMDFKQSQRLQRAVEHSRVTGFVLRNATGKLTATACAARWQIKPLPSLPINGLPGVGHFCWQVDLLKVRNGQTGSWVMQWHEGMFEQVTEILFDEERQVG
ncbi:Error-prone repair protein ImuA [Mucilaginibacter roseus]|uniref:Error-prone repair protein ImuA n=1 Tax=Mucilaginibacter roseus TaxID=1528868 RepID=A0ABS8TZZ7_9SPHI|nr:Error-prone repair protein ImuA [Mucilaginibacter roseus]MCD8739572.1 Error-prone repair protein ImuA [Mucilaginibacter roseus]